MMHELISMGRWAEGDEAPTFTAAGVVEAVRRCREAIAVVQDPASGRLGVGLAGHLAADGGYPLVALLPPLYPEWLGDRGFGERHCLRFPYVVGAMANGITTEAMVTAAAEAGAIGFFGAAGLELARVEAAVVELAASLDPRRRSWGANLIHSPHEPTLEEAVVDLYLRHGVRRVSASAFMAMQPAVVRYAASGLTRAADGRLLRANHVFAKVSRPEVARRFLEPPPEAMLRALVAAGRLSAAEAELASSEAVASAVTVEADSGGHTDRGALATLLGVVLRQRDAVALARGYREPIHVGAAGGLGTPDAVAAAFVLGAAYVLTGSVNQACAESGLGGEGRRLLARAGSGDVAMAPAADMFEMGVEVQVLKLGTLFAVRARRLYEIYRATPSLAALADPDREWLERDIFRRSLAAEWEATAAYWRGRDPREHARADRDPHHQLALLFRSYLGQSSRWAIDDVADRRVDFQIWCGPAMGAFNAWSEGSFLAEPGNRRVAQVALNLLEGAAVVTRAQQLRTAGLAVPAAAFDFRPRPLA